MPLSNSFAAIRASAMPNLPSAAHYVHNLRPRFWKTRGATVNKKFFTTWIVVFIVSMAGSFVVHAELLHGDYAALASLFRTEADAQRYFPLMIIAHVIGAGAFTWIYMRGHEARPRLLQELHQGLHFGLAVALLTVVPTYLIYYAVQPMPGVTVVKQIVCDSILTLIMGAAAALVNRRPQSA